ncbi:MAG: phosphoribosylamine--glycine ligase N-terminal domain-containing protein [Planctomycetota bacterium]
MDVLVVGAGGREHALCWKIAQSPLVDKLYCAPGNGGTHRVARNVPIKADDLDAQSASPRRRASLTVVVPQDPLCLGIVDGTRRRACGSSAPTNGPRRSRAAPREAFCRDLCRKHRIPRRKLDLRRPGPGQ